MDILQDPAGAAKASSNDTCTYTLRLTSTTEHDQAALQAIATSILAYVRELSKDPAIVPSTLSKGTGYLWQRDGFNLRPLEGTKNLLQGNSRVGESIEDEWFIVHLLLEISKKWADQLVMEVHDDDGQFLLIEAAEHLPNWLNPDNAENRFWIANGQFHLIPLSYVSAEGGSRPASELDNKHYLSADDAIRALSPQSLAPQAVKGAILARVEGFMQTLRNKTHYHRAIMQLPVEIVEILEAQPGLVAKAVTAFYERDAIQLKACQYMRRFPPSPHSIASVQLTRSLYAQLMSQKFYPPKIFEKAGWQTSVDAAPAPPSDAGQPDRTQAPSFDEAKIRKQAKWTELGVKLACGFEILYQETKSTRVNVRGDANGGQHFSQNQGYLRYLTALTNSGYFQGEIPGSKKYSQLEAQAVHYWQELQASGDKAQSPAKIIDDLREARKAAAPNSAPQQDVDLSEDSDDWLYIDQNRLEDMLKSKSGASKPDRAEENGMDVDTGNGEQAEEDEDEKLAREQAKRLQSMAEKFQGFIEGEGSVEGALFDDEASDHDMSDEEGDDDDNDAEETVAGPSVLTAEEKQERLSKLVPSLATTEWGQAAHEAAKALNTPKDGKAEQSADRRKHTVEVDAKRVQSKFASKYDGVSSDESSDEDDGFAATVRLPGGNGEIAVGLDDEDEDDRAQIVDDEGLEFGEGEMEEFLNFTREALGLTEDQYKDIVENRRERGAFVPAEKGSAPSSDKTPGKQSSKSSVRPSTSTADGSRAASTVRDIPDFKQSTAATAAPSSQPQNPPLRNPNLNSFDALMDAMDAELRKQKAAHSSPAKAGSGSGRRKTSRPTRKTVDGMVIVDDSDPDAVSSDEDDESEGGMMGGEDDDENMAMEEIDAELAAALRRDPADRNADGDGLDYAMITNFLESFKSQSGLAGPVSNMFGRLDKDFVMPRDE